MNTNNKIVTVHHTGVTDADEEVQQTSCCFSWCSRLLRRLRRRLTKRGTTVPYKEDQVSLPTMVTVPALPAYCAAQEENVLVTVTKVFIPPHEAAPALPHPCLVFLLKDVHLKEPVEGMALFTRNASEAVTKVIAAVVRPPIPVVTVSQPMVKEQNEAKCTGKTTLTIILHLVKREAIKNVDEVVAEEPRPLKGIIKKGKTTNTAPKCLRFKFDNLNGFVKDRELYSGYDYFRYGVPLSTIRSYQTDCHGSYPVREAPRHHRSSEVVQQHSARNAAHSRLYGQYFNDTATGANNSSARPHCGNRRYYRASRTRKHNTPAFRRYSGPRKPH